MTTDDIIRMAQEVGLCNEVGGIEGDAGSYYSYTEEIRSLWQAAFKAGTAVERETIAQLFDAIPEFAVPAIRDAGICTFCGFSPKKAAEAIRARKKP